MQHLELSPVKKQVADRIRKLRMDNGFSQENVAHDLGITHSSYSKIERGETDPNLSRLFELAKIFNVSITDFFTDDRVSSLKEKSAAYGNNADDDFEKLNQSIQKLLTEIGKLRSELSERNTSSGYRKKK